MGFSPRGGGWETRFERVVWRNAPRRLRWRHIHENVMMDLDGSFSGRPGTPSQLVPMTPMLKSTRAFPECERDPHAQTPQCTDARCQADIFTPLEGARCTGLRFVRFSFNRMLPNSLQNVQALFRHDGARGSFVTASDTAYLADKWRPLGDRFLVSMDVSTGVGPVNPVVVGDALWVNGHATGDRTRELSTRAASNVPCSVLRLSRTGVWDGIGGSFIFLELDTNGGVRSTSRSGRMSADGTRLSWDDAFRPWIRCSASPSECVGNIRYNSPPSCVTSRAAGCDMPTTAVEFGLKRRTHSNGYVALLPVNRLYEFEWDLREHDRVDIERVRTRHRHIPHHTTTGRAL
jgi:hypothetical protein